MNLKAAWFRWPLMILAAGGIAYGLFGLGRGLLFGDIYSRIAITLLLVLWVVFYRVIRRFFFETLPKDWKQDQNSN